MKVALRTNFPATARAIQRGLYGAVARAGHNVADRFGKDSQKAIRSAMVSTGLGRMAGAVRYASSTSKRRANVQNGGSPSRIALVGRQRAWAVVFNVGGDRSRGAFDVYSARPATTIRPTNGKRWLAFPTKAIPQRVGKNKMTPALYNRSSLVRSIGPLIFIKGVSANVAYLAVKQVSVTSKTGSKPRALGPRGGVGAGRKKKELLIAFILIRATVRTQRFNPIALMERQMGPALIRLGEQIQGWTKSNPVPTQPLFSASGTSTATFIPVLRA